MNTLEAISKRHSYRGKYKSTIIPKQDLIKIMEAGLKAPSGCNKQTTSLIAVDDKEVLKNIHDVIEPDIAQSAPAMICVLTKRVIAHGNKCYAEQDYAAAIENMLLACTELGYASCWYEGHITSEDRICDKIAKVLNVPNNYELVCLLPIGIADEETIIKDKKPFEERAWFNRFNG